MKIMELTCWIDGAQCRAAFMEETNLWSVDTPEGNIHLTSDELGRAIQLGMDKAFA